MGTVRFVGLALKAVMQHDRDFVDVILLYYRYSLGVKRPVRDGQPPLSVSEVQIGWNHTSVFAWHVVGGNFAFSMK